MTNRIDTIKACCEDFSIPVSVADPSRPDCPLVHVNAAFTDLTGYSNAEIKGRNCRFLQGDGTSHDAVEQIADAVRNRSELITCLLNYRKDGEPFHNLLIIEPVEIEPGHVLLMGCQYAFSRDVGPDSLFDQARLVSQAANEIDVKTRDILTMQVDAVKMRADSAIFTVKSYLDLAIAKGTLGLG